MISNDNNRLVKTLLHNPLSNYLRARPNSTVTRLLKTALRANHRNGTEYQELDIPLSSILCGGEHWLTAAQYARHAGDLLRPSRPISELPHTKFLTQYLEIGDKVFCPEIFGETAYYKNAVQCISTVGHYFVCVREEQVKEIARRFVTQLSQNRRPNDLKSPYFSTAGDPIVARPILYSRCYEIVDGAHRAAIACVRGEAKIHARVIQPPAITPLQQLVLDHAWTRGRRELSQPLDSPELSDWTLVRRCKDRFELMKSFMEKHALLPFNGESCLDIASNFGWFVSAFEHLGFQSYGVDMDWAACEIARLVFGLGPDKVTRSEVVRFLQRDSRKYDITSCLSLMHHFAMGLHCISAEEMLRLIAEKTRVVLFFEMGQAHEEWFGHTLAGWHSDYIEHWLGNNSSFTKIYRLGTDRDNVPPYERNYGRTLFACVR